MDLALAQLVEMGYDINQSTKALQLNEHSFDKALNWLFKHPSASPKPPLTKPNKPNKPPPKPPKNGKQRRVESLLNMGFDEEDSVNALRLNQNNVQKAIEYLLTNIHKPSDLDDFVLVNDEEEKKKDAEWEQITDLDIKNHAISPWDMQLQNEYECTVLSPYKLKQIITKCPTRTHLYKWKLVYSNEKHGLSTNTFYDKLENVEESILVINDRKYDSVFGAFIDCKWMKPKNKGKKYGYKGTIDCFVFNYMHNNDIKDKDKNELMIYKGSGYKKYFFRNDTDAVTIGAGECPAIYFDYEFNFGRTVKCDTFNSPSLTNGQEFQIKQLQIWAPIIDANLV